MQFVHELKAPKRCRKVFGGEEDDSPINFKDLTLIKGVNRKNKKKIIIKLATYIIQKFHMLRKNLTYVHIKMG